MAGEPLDVVGSGCAAPPGRSDPGRPGGADPAPLHQRSHLDRRHRHRCPDAGVLPVGRHPAARGGGWLTYMLVTSVYRFAEARRYERAAPGPAEAGPWGTRFLLGTALAAFGWGAAGILLYPDAPVMNQVLLVFIVGGMMLGGASVLAPRSDAFLTFLLPTGLVPAARLLVSGDSPHVVMGLLAALFTGAVLVSTPEDSSHDRLLSAPGLREPGARPRVAGGQAIHRRGECAARVPCRGADGRTRSRLRSVCGRRSASASRPRRSCCRLASSSRSAFSPAASPTTSITF